MGRNFPRKIGDGILELSKIEDIWSVGLWQPECLILAVFVTCTLTMGQTGFESSWSRSLRPRLGKIHGYRYVFGECFVSQDFFSPYCLAPQASSLDIFSNSVWGYSGSDARQGHGKNTTRSDGRLRLLLRYARMVLLLRGGSSIWARGLRMCAWAVVEAQWFWPVNVRIPCGRTGHSSLWRRQFSQLARWIYMIDHDCTEYISMYCI